MSKFGALCLSLLTVAATARRYTGSLEGAKFGYIGKFVFGYDERNQIEGEPIHPVGEISIEISGPVADDLTFFVYSDEDASWSSIYGNNDMTCAQKTAKAKKPIIGGKVSPTPGIPVVLTEDAECKVSPCFIHREKIAQSLRPRYWYTVLARTGDCDTKLTNVQKFDLTFLNYDKDGSSTEFSVDEYGVSSVFVVSLLIWVAALLVHFNAHRKAEFEFKAPVLRYFHVSLVLEAASLLCHTIHWSVYGANGYGLPGLNQLGELLNVFATVTMWVMLAFLAMGYGISTVMLSDGAGKGNIVGLITIFAFGLAYTVMTLWYYFLRDEAATEYIYDSIPGFLVLVVQCIYAVWWALKLKTIYELEPTNTKRNFYVMSFFLYGAWFGSIPVIAFVSSLIAPWYRMGIVTISVAAFNTLVYLASIILMWPSNARDIFSPPKSLATFDANSDMMGGYTGL